MKLEIEQESISKLLGHGEKDVLRSPSTDLFYTTLTGAVKTHQAFRLSSLAGRLPLVVIPADYDLEDFFATVATYYPSQSPLTAYVHVLGAELMGCFEAAAPNIIPDNNMLSRGQLARLGACLGETVLASLGSNESTLTPSFSACKRSLGYAFARSEALYPKLDTNITLERWSRLRYLTGLAVSQYTANSVCAIHAAATDDFEYLNNADLISQLKVALVSYMTASDEDDALQVLLRNCYPRLNEIDLGMNDGPFDARMGSFLRTVEEIQRSTLGIETDSLAVGYFCNKIQPGSFTHGKVLTRLVDFFPSALVWYGMFCSTSRNFDVGYFGNGLFEKLGRDVSQPFSFAQRPQCDLSLDELEVLMRTSVKAEAIKPIQQKIASVALLPGLDVFSRFASDNDGQRGGELPVMRIGVPDKRLSRATQLLDEAASLLHQIGDQDGVPPNTSKPKRQRKR